MSLKGGGLPCPLLLPRPWLGGCSATLGQEDKDRSLQVAAGTWKAPRSQVVAEPCQGSSGLLILRLPPEKAV